MVARRRSGILLMSGRWTHGHAALRCAGRIGRIAVHGGRRRRCGLGAAYELATHPTLAALPVFTLAGFVLAEGDTATRLLGIFRAWWLDAGGTAVVCVLVCAFFTIFTGGSGVTIWRSVASCCQPSCETITPINSPSAC